jgi:hypothetical protein
MNRKLLMAAVVPAFALIAGSVVANDDGDRKNNSFRAELKPTDEVPAVSSIASGRFEMTIDEANQTIAYELSYEGLEGTVAQAHIHIGQFRVNGGISIFLCGNPPTVPPANITQPPACPASPATVTGTLTPDMLVGPVPQGIEQAAPTVNEFQELIDLIRSGDAYANVHSSRFPGGEVRGQIQPGSGS